MANEIDSFIRGYKDSGVTRRQEDTDNASLPLKHLSEREIEQV